MNVLIIPCYKVSNHILKVLGKIDDRIDQIFVVDDCCPEGSGRLVQKHCRDPRVEVIIHEENQGVGGAMITGYKAAIKKNAKICVKIDGDGQMDTSKLGDFIDQIQRGYDYAKGNRFFNVHFLKQMPRFRLFGNSMLSLVNKFVNGYWNIMDPTNGYTAIHRNTLEKIPLNQLDQRYFFESDMLFQLSLIRASIVDIPLAAQYGDEKSSLNIYKVLFSFPTKYAKRFFKRLFYLYFLRDFNAGTLLFSGAFLLTIVGTVLGAHWWYSGWKTDNVTTSGQVMIATLPIIAGIQLFISAFQYDIQSRPKRRNGHSQ